MRILLIHANHLNYKTKNQTRIAEKISEELKQGHFENPLVVFTAVEKEDEENPEEIVKNAFAEIIDVFEKVGAKEIVIYPYAHLSSSLSSPEAAKKILEDIKAELIKNDYPVARVPFGWYKSFEVSCKGHPLSELSRTISVGKEKTKEKTDEEPSKFFIISNGKVHDLEGFKVDSSDMEKLIDHELGQSQSSGEEPPHVKLMREKNLADYEPSADVGHLRWYPKGRLIRDLLSDYVYQLVTERGAMPVETPIMYDLQDDAIRVHAEKFGERQYRMGGKKELMLRYACCFGAFRVLSDTFLTWKNLPVGIYELSTYSFRLEKKGEVVGLKRLRGFTMPDLHTVCTDMSQAMDEFESQIDMCSKTGEDFNINYEAIIRVTRDFLEQNKDWVFQAAAKINKPVLLEVLPKRKHYWIAKMDFAAIDYLGRPIENPTIQIDVESGERFGITYIDKEEKEHYPIILHCSPTGSIERVICSLLENAAIDIGDKNPMLPVWLSPIQARIIPIAERHIDFSLDLAEELRDSGIRVDVDDRHETVGKKIRNSASEWIPYVAVIGDKEIEDPQLMVNIRKTGKKSQMNVGELINVIKSDMGYLPFRPLPLPVLLSKRVNF